MIYLDTSVIVPLFLPEARSLVAENLFARGDVVVSDLAAAEFSSALALATRTGRIPEAAARTAFGLYDDWIHAHTTAAEVRNEDLAAAKGLIRRFDLALRTPDAIHLAICARLGGVLATFDARMACAGALVGLTMAV